MYSSEARRVNLGAGLLAAGGFFLKKPLATGLPVLKLKKEGLAPNFRTLFA
jgi:hypothetical protein